MIVNDAFEDVLNVIIIVIYLNTNHTLQQTIILTYLKKHLHRNVVKIVPSNIQLMQQAHRLSCAQHLAHAALVAAVADADWITAVDKATTRIGRSVARQIARHRERHVASLRTPARFPEPMQGG